MGSDHTIEDISKDKAAEDMPTQAQAPQVQSDSRMDSTLAALSGHQAQCRTPCRVSVALTMGWDITPYLWRVPMTCQHAKSQCLQTCGTCLSTVPCARVVHWGGLHRVLKTDRIPCRTSVRLLQTLWAKAQDDF